MFASKSMEPVLTAAQIDLPQLTALVARFGLRTVLVAEGAAIPGSFWGDREAGLIGSEIFFRLDSPLQSVLHEACHWICMDAARRTALHQDAGGDFAEENAVCYLQILLADYVDGLGRERMLADMDAWGYTFRLGSAQTWFEQDAAEARQWLVNMGLLDMAHTPTWSVRC